jgi:hypothetical protein
MRRGLERIKAFLNRCMFLSIPVGILLAQSVEMVDQPVVVLNRLSTPYSTGVVAVCASVYNVVTVIGQDPHILIFDLSCVFVS